LFLLTKGFGIKRKNEAHARAQLLNLPLSMQGAGCAAGDSKAAQSGTVHSNKKRSFSLAVLKQEFYKRKILFT